VHSSLASLSSVSSSIHSSSNVRALNSTVYCNITDATELRLDYIPRIDSSGRIKKNCIVKYQTKLFLTFFSRRRRFLIET